MIAIVLAGCSSKPVKQTPAAAPPPAPIAHKPPPPKIIPRPKPLTGLALVNSLLPPTLADRGGWAADIYAAFENIKIAPSKENICAVVAEIEQESSFQSEPVVVGLKKIVRRELEASRKKYSIPQWVMDSSLDLKSPDGRTYNERIDALRTENDVNKFFEDMISEIPFGQKFLADYNPVRTGGPMQVSLSFANAYVAMKPYPYAVKGSLRNELFSRKGGLFFGIAYLLDYPVGYDNLIFRFADFNSGLYSSRNAAFQNAASTLSGATLAKDGDLLRYKNGVALEDASQTMQALLNISSRLNMDRSAIFRDLLLEKSSAFEQSQLYTKIFALAPSLPRALIPEIELNSPKITRKFTTASYAKHVDQRYRDCLKRYGQRQNETPPPHQADH